MAPRSKALGALRTPPGEPAPATLASPGQAPGVLAFHGFGGTPLEVELVVSAASELGLWAEAPLLPGHGTHASDLARTRWSDWSASAQEAFARAPRPVIVAGLSMGSLLALDLAAAHADSVAGLILLANAAWLTAPFPSWALLLAERLALPDFLAPKGGPDIADERGRSTHVAYDCHPVHAAIEVRRAGVRVRERLSRVRCPVLVLHGARDRVCPVANAWRVAQGLGSMDVKVVVFPRSRHILTRDHEHVAVRREIVGFLDRVAGSPARAQTPVEP